MTISKKQINKAIIALQGVEYAFIDLFCGAGGTSTGIEDAIAEGKHVAKVVLCINHDYMAIQSHMANHKDAIHLVEDVRKVKMKYLIPLITEIRRAYPHIKIGMWASLECTNFSKAKGGQPRDADSRTLAEDLLRYNVTINPDKIYIENVEEFMSWGPLDSNNKPISKNAGQDYTKWIKNVCAQGYTHEYRIINSADLGAYMSRKRYFGQFIRPTDTFKWPVETHHKKANVGEVAWMPVKEVLNLESHGISIFERKKPLSPKTIERILIGAKRYVVPNDPNFFIKYHSTGNNVLGLNGPASTLSTKDRLGLIQTQFIDKQYTSGGRNQSIEKPAGSITTVPKMNLVTCQPFIMDTQFNNIGQSIDSPAGVITANRKWHYLINPQWFNTSPISVDKPCPTLIARMDKAPMYLATADQEEIVNVFIIQSIRSNPKPVIRTKTGNLIYTVSIYATHVMKELVLFMAALGIVDIKMRMLEIDELLSIQGFPKNYVLRGTKTLQKKFIGNSVVPVVAQKLIEANFT